jgi:hypothetical protein
MNPAAASRALADHAGSLAATALANVRREYPNAPAHTLLGNADPQLPRQLHPTFYGAFDWHSAVHMHWLLVRLLRTHPDHIDAVTTRRVLNEHLTTPALHAEADYLRINPGWERPYGWAWLLTLAAECTTFNTDPDAASWAHALRDPVDTIADLLTRWLPRATYPLRDGGHTNTAFSLGLILDTTNTLGLPELDTQIRDWALRSYLGDRDAPAAWEPSGHDFLSPSLSEADLLRRVLDPETFSRWLESFLPGLAHEELPTLLTPVHVTDRSDGLLGHLDGLNFSRSTALRAIAEALPHTDPRHHLLHSATVRHLDAALPSLTAQDYASTHWLGTFAALALTTA